MIRALLILSTLCAGAVVAGDITAPDNNTKLLIAAAATLAYVVFGGLTILKHFYGAK